VFQGKDKFGGVVNWVMHSWIPKQD